MIHKEPDRMRPFIHLLRNRRPSAYARMRGNADYPGLMGMVYLYGITNGTLLAAEFSGLPEGSGACSAPVFGFHIHEGTQCTGNTEDPFADTGPHFNPNDCLHPRHAGDLPPIFGCDGYAFAVVYTNRFLVSDVIGRTVVLHHDPDDFMTQPAGHSGGKIACGEIIRN